MDNNENLVNSTQQDIQNLAHGAKEAAGSAKTVAKAAGKAASGNYVGAAVDVIKDKNVRRTVIALALIPVFLITSLLIVVLYVFPMSMYEALQNIFSKANTEFWNHFYSDDGGGLKGILKGTGGWLKSIFSTLFTDILNGSEKMSLEQQFEADKNVVTGYMDDEDETKKDKNAASDSLVNKLQQTKSKYELRAKAILQAIESAQGRALVDAKCRGNFQKTYTETFHFDDEPAGSDTVGDVYKGFSYNKSSVSTNLTDLQALWFSTLYSVQMDNDFGVIEMSDYLKWLGWNSRKNQATMNLPIMDGSVPVTGWGGTFMPQYLVDEARQLATIAGEEAKKEEMEKGKTEEKTEKAYDKAYNKVYDEYTTQYGTSAIDLMTVAFVSKSVTPVEQDGSETDPSHVVAPGTYDGLVFQYSDESYENIIGLAPGLQNVFNSYTHYKIDEVAADMNEAKMLALSNWYYQNGVLSRSNYETNGAADPEEINRGHIVQEFYMTPVIVRKLIHTTYYFGPSSWTPDGSERIKFAIPPYMVYTSLPAWIPFYEGFCSKYGAYSWPATAYDYGLFTFDGQVDYYDYIEEIKWVPAVRTTVYRYYKDVSYNVPVYIQPRAKTAMQTIAGLIAEDKLEEKIEYVTSMYNSAVAGG